MELRTMAAKAGDFEARETVRENGAPEMRISGYFIRFDDIYDYGFNASESVSNTAIHLERDKDIRVLTNHDSRLVLGRTTAGTAELRVDDKGLYADILINPNDQDAVNTWARVQRGDVSQCSFGFNILKESHETREDGHIHFTLEDVELHEISVCTFPAYEGTSVSARAADAENLRKREFETWKETALNKHTWLRKEN